MLHLGVCHKVDYLYALLNRAFKLLLSSCFRFSFHNLLQPKSEHMKKSLFLFIILCFLVTDITAQILETSAYTINWTGIQTWKAQNYAKAVISFEGAVYPTSQALPYFVTKKSVQKSVDLRAEVVNPQFIPLSDSELQIIQSSIFTHDLQIVSNLIEDEGVQYQELKILPFVNHNGKLMKLKSFEIQYSFSPKMAPAKSPQKQSLAISNSVLSSGNFVKIKVSKTGIYKLSFESLQKMGVDPANAHVFGYGGNVLSQNLIENKYNDLPELSVYEYKGADGVFNAGDYILFYAKGPVKQIFNSNEGFFRHKNNSYSTHGYYFVSSNVGVGKRIGLKPTIDISQMIVDTIRQFADYQVYEKDLINLIPHGSGKEFYGNSLSSNVTLNIPFSFPNVVGSKDAHVYLDLAINSQVSSSLKFYIDGVENYSTSVNANTPSQYNYNNAIESKSYYLFNPTKDDFNFGIKYSSSVSGSTGYLNYVGITAHRQLKMHGSEMPFQSIEYLDNGGAGKFLLENANANLQVWDITEPSDIKLINSTIQGSILSFIDGTNDFTQYLALDPTSASAFPEPEVVGVISNQNLHGLSPAKFVIITNPLFLTQANQLAEVHRTVDKISVAVVTTDQVYNEFSSGTPDATAIRMFMRMLYDKSITTNDLTNQPKYLLLFGKGTYDNRKLIANSGSNLVITYQGDNSLNTSDSYVSDDYFGILSDYEGVNEIIYGKMQLGVGRFPVNTAQQATDVVNKTIAYIKNEEQGLWKNQVCFIADDEDLAVFKTQADEIAETMKKSNPATQVNKIYLDAFKLNKTASGGTYPMANTKFENLINSGVMMINYTGHSGTTGWAAERILSNDDIVKMTNKKLPLWLSLSCDFSTFDHDIVSGGENILLNPIGGGIGSLACARLAWDNPNFRINKEFCKIFLNKIDGENPRIGDLVKITKNNSLSSASFSKLAYVYFGDPAVQLHFPNDYTVTTTSINDDTTLLADTISALSIVKVKGVIKDTMGVLQSNFNGIVNAVIYDKEMTINMLNNHNEDYSNLPASLKYIDRPNILFSGKFQVVKGKFEFTFKVPKDIKYNFGKGKINYYACDTTNKFEAQGYFENIVVGGIDPNSNQNVTNGPETNIYLNTTNFVSGAKVNETPIFYATVMDINGINTVGSGIGHDITLCIDNDPQMVYNLNENFVADLNSYTSGSISYKLPEIEEGKHSMTFRVWNLMNVSTSKTIDFEVVKGLAPMIFSVTNVPNPVINDTRFVIEHDRPETILNATVDLFDLTGKKIWSRTQPTIDDIYWNVSMSDGVNIQPGMYIYKISISTANSGVYSKTNKMIILKQ